MILRPTALYQPACYQTHVHRVTCQGLSTSTWHISAVPGMAACSHSFNFVEHGRPTRPIVSILEVNLKLYSNRHVIHVPICHSVVVLDCLVSSIIYAAPGPDETPMM